MISVVTLTHNKLACTQRCLRSYFQTTGGQWELIVVDNGSTDGTREWLQDYRTEAASQGVPVTVIQNPGNIGCCTARNQGIACAQGHYIVFVDNDVALRTRSWLSRMAAACDADPAIAMVGPKIVYPYPPHNIQFAGGAVSPSGRVQFCGRGEARTDPRFTYRREVQFAISACCMVRRDCLARHGGFDEAFNPVEYEEIDLAYRLRSKGYKILYLPDVEMYHFESVTTAGTAALPNKYLIIKHGLLFKQRWRHMFAHENGPSDTETQWRPIPRRAAEAIGELETIE